MVKRQEVANQLNQYAKEINETIRSGPDEVTGYRSFNPIISEFMADRGQFTVLTAFIEATCSLSIDIHEPLSKKLVAERMLCACNDMLDLSEQHVKKLEEYLAVPTLKEKRSMIEPLKDNVVIKASEITPGGIFLPDRAQKDPKFGVVDSVGPDVQALKPGDTILLPGWDDVALEIDGEKYIVLVEKSISVRISE